MALKARKHEQLIMVTKLYSVKQLIMVTKLYSVKLWPLFVAQKISWKQHIKSINNRQWAPLGSKKSETRMSESKERCKERGLRHILSKNNSRLLNQAVY